MQTVINEMYLSFHPPKKAPSQIGLCLQRCALFKAGVHGAYTLVFICSRDIWASDVRRDRGTRALLIVRLISSRA